jgi:hypothetical protein
MSSAEYTKAVTANKEGGQSLKPTDRLGVTAINCHIFNITRDSYQLR